MAYQRSIYYRSIYYDVLYTDVYGRVWDGYKDSSRRGYLFTFGFVSERDIREVGFDRACGEVLQRSKMDEAAMPNMVMGVQPQLTSSTSFTTGYGLYNRSTSTNATLTLPAINMGSPTKVVKPVPETGLAWLKRRVKEICDYAL